MARQKIDPLGLKLAQALQRVDRPAKFSASGVVPVVLPGLEVEGVGTISLPLQVAQAKELRKVCQRAGYGKGEQTIVDTSVRRVWKLSPQSFAPTNPEWSAAKDRVVANVQRELGLEQELEAHLYDLLLYEKGGFFLPHRDGEKLHRMVATLIILLPSSYTGGELVVRNEGQEQVIDFSGEAGKFQTHYAAFYADCEHEVRPLLSGFRICLIYNLTLARSKGSVSAPESLQHVSKIADILRDWPAVPSDPEKLVVTLTHQYTKDGLAWDALKGVDRARSLVLAEAARQSQCHAYLALLTLWECGSVAYDGQDVHGYGRRRHRYPREEEARGYVIEEIIDTSLKAERLQRPDGRPMPLEFLIIRPSEVVTEESLKAVDPEEDLQGYTGNEGLTLDRWYRHAAIVLWPDSRHFDVLCNDNARTAVPLLKQMVRDFQEADASERESQRERCKIFARTILHRWPRQEHRPRRQEIATADSQDPTPVLVDLHDADLVALFLRNALSRDASLEPARGLSKSIASHGWVTLKPDLVGLFEKTSSESIERDARLLKQLCMTASESPASKIADARITCHELAALAIAALIRVDIASKSENCRFFEVDRCGVVTLLTRSLLTAGFEDLLPKLFRHVSQNPNQYPLLTVQVPALAELGEWLNRKPKLASAALEDWGASCIAQLESLTTVPPSPPADYRREAAVRCKCKYCAELNQFLGDADSSECRFQVAQESRRHIETNVRGYKCDLACKTDKKPRPQVLICTKNNRSFEQRAAEYNENVKRLKALQSFSQQRK